MRVHNDTRLRPAWLVAAQAPPQLSATWIVKGTYRLRPDGTATEVEEPEFPDGDRFYDGQPEAGLRSDSDFAPLKPRTDLILIGSCYPPGGAPATVCHASFGVGRWKKTVAAVGDRHWRRSNVGVGISEPRPFASMPLRYSLAYGGPGYARNPIGRGFRMESLPNVEYPDRPVTSWEAELEPAGFGPLLRTSPQRTKGLGAYDADWLKDRWPWFPIDFDWGHFNAAPHDQQVNAFPRGDEPLLLENLHPMHARYSTRLPAVRPQLFVVDDGGPREVSLRLDTIWVDADRETLVLLWRGALPIRSIKLADVRELHLVQTALSESRLSAEDVLRRVARKAEDAARVKADEAAADARETADFEATMTRHEKEAEALLAAAQEESKRASGALPDELRALGLRALAPAVDVPAQPLPTLRQVLEEAVSDPEVGPIAKQLLSAEMPELDEPAAEDPWTRDRCLEHARRGGRFADENLSGLDLSRADLSGCDFHGAVLSGVVFTRSKLRGCNLSRADLSGAVLVDTDLRGADLSRADLSGVKATGARMDGARLERATFSEALLDGASLQEVAADRADFSAANLSRAHLVAGHFFKANFSEAIVEQADFSRAVLEHAQMQGTRGPKAVFSGADIRSLHAGNAPDFSGASFTACRGDASYWEGAQLDRADFTDAHLQRSDFEAASLERATFLAADLSHASLHDVRACHVDLRGAKLFRASLQRAILSDADLGAACLYEADLWDADFTGANTRGADLRMTRRSVEP